LGLGGGGLSNAKRDAVLAFRVFPFKTVFRVGMVLEGGEVEHIVASQILSDISVNAQEWDDSEHH
jgi:hypothetical protein